ncbi:LIM domain protein [Aspergillus japonicus CBS 114.51]|uniref:LIM domain protein n=2 Tax=Aspergillus TaxID=5052 RepID=A0A2V5HHZ7_ASPV1|nr:LIM domain protein [Aspergillus japonicus CBS 114.51]PYI24045.1 LIM domain protein [Aspergillus violaceofuscus CBS 115571]RAH78425.1 LIM domain protein [Aspergillus japonicus CBS 114.51]
MASMMHRPQFQKPKEGQRKFSPPGPTYMSDDQIATYLKDLRTNRPTRPGGSRPLPVRPTTAPTHPHDDLPPRAASAMSSYGPPRTQSSPPSAEARFPRATSSLSNHRPASALGGPTGRPLVQEPRTIPIRQTVSPAQVFSRVEQIPARPTYRENPQRRIEKEEARSLRDALQEMDLHDEHDLHAAAQDEATELVWMHQNPGIPYKNPYAPYQNPDLQDLQQSPPRSSFASQNGAASSPTARRDSRRLMFQGSTVSHSGTNGFRGSDRKSSVEGGSQTILEEEGSSPTKSPTKGGSMRRSMKVNFALPQEDEPTVTSGDNHGLGSASVRNETSRGIFRNPNDQIYEEPHLSPRKDEGGRSIFSRSDSSALKSKPRNALPRGSRPLPGRFGSLSFVDKLSRFEIHKNPPSQTRNPEYTTNEPRSQEAPPEPEAPQQQIPTKDGLEIRSDELRAATSKKLRDRSTRLPMPTAVSDRAGRPIVSFDPRWKPTEAQSPPKRDKGWDATPQPPPPAPTIEVSEASSVPVINLPDDKEPTISEISGSRGGSGMAVKPLPTPPKSNAGLNRAPPKTATTSTSRWLSTYTRSGVPTAKCESCTLPIAGKIVTAAGTRFHPECFVCHHCQTPLECVAFYQEPDAKRAERLAESAADDEEARTLRFYCHLDFHELFSPRCKSCKTPIEGEVVVACGAEWHVGHFFCAECGDPFSSEKPFVEKDGFAWCLQCHSRRTAPRCLGCKKPVLDDVVISAIDGQWHDQCFVCHECGDGFGPEGRYFVREGEPKRTAKGRIIGGPVQLAVCERCEGIRLKASP